MDDREIEERLKSLPRLRLTEEFRRGFVEKLRAFAEAEKELREMPSLPLSPRLQERFRATLAATAERKRRTLLRRIAGIAACLAVVALLLPIVLNRDDGARPGSGTVAPPPSVARSAPPPPTDEELLQRGTEAYAAVVVRKIRRSQEGMRAYLDGKSADCDLSALPDLKGFIRQELADALDRHRQAETDDTQRRLLDEKIRRATRLLAVAPIARDADLLSTLAARYGNYSSFFVATQLTMGDEIARAALRKGLRDRRLRPIYFEEGVRSNRDLLLDVCRELDRSGVCRWELKESLIILGDRATVEEFLAHASRIRNVTRKTADQATLIRRAISRVAELPATPTTVATLIELISHPLFRDDARMVLRALSGRDAEYDRSRWKEIFFLYPYRIGGDV